MESCQRLDFRMVDRPTLVFAQTRKRPVPEYAPHFHGHDVKHRPNHRFVRA